MTKILLGHAVDGGAEVHMACGVRGSEGGRADGMRARDVLFMGDS